jgi:hypothetical protein
MAEVEMADRFELLEAFIKPSDFTRRGGASIVSPEMV